MFDAAGCTLTAPDRPPKVDRAYKSATAIGVDSTSLGNQGALGKVVARPTREYNDLEIAALLSKQHAKPVHAVVVALNELVVQYDCRAQIFGKR